MRVITFTTLVFALVGLPAFATDFDDGIKFYGAKDYASALASFKKAAVEAENDANTLFFNRPASAQLTMSRS